jgi:hypothetical protein
MRHKRCAFAVSFSFLKKDFSAVLWAFLITSSIIGFVSASSADQPLCPPLQPPATSYPTWEQDANYELIETPVEGGKIIRITGDILNFDKPDFGSIIRDVDEAPSNVREIIFDAREIHLKQPLSFTSARIVILSDLLSFEENGAINLTLSPNGSDGLRVVARKIQLSGALPVPIQIVTSDKRTVQIAAEALEIDGGSETATARDVLWRRSSGFSGKAGDPPAEWDVKVGSEFSGEVADQLAAEAVWPQFTAFKIQKFFARDPYGTSNNLIQANRPYFEQLKATSALSLLDATKRLLELHLDPSGHGPAFVPRRDYINAFNALKGEIEGSQSYLDDLKKVILQAYDEKPLDQSQLAAVRSRQRSDEEAARSVNQSMSDVVTSLAQNEQDIDAIQTKVNQRTGTLVAQVEDAKHKAGDLGKLKAGTTVLATGAMLIPGAGPFIATGISVVGSVIYSHNVGQDPGSVETLASVAQKNAKFYATAKAVQAAWEQQVKDYKIAGQVFAGKPPQPDKPGDKPLDRAEAAKKEAQSAGEFASKVKDMFDELQDQPKPTEVALSDVEKNDEELNSLLAAIGDRREQQAKLTEQIKELQGKLASVMGDQADAMNVEVDLLAANPINDRDIMRWKLSAVSLWRREIERLYNDAIMVRRSLFFETGKIPELPPDVFQFPEEMTAYVKSGLYNPDKGLNSKEVTEAHLDAEITKHVAALKAIQGALSDAFSQFESERAMGAVPYVQSFTFSASSPNLIVQRFIKQLNAQILRQVVGGTDQGLHLAPLLIPFTLPTAPMSDPERLVSVNISDVQFTTTTATAGKTINFDIRYNLAGEMIRDGSCHFVDMRESSAQSFVVLRVQATNQSLPPSEGGVPLTFEEFKRFQTAPPARTPYFLSVQIGGDRTDPTFTKSIPEIKSLTFSIKVVQ